jgi:hypothetical protein
MSIRGAILRFQNFRDVCHFKMAAKTRYKKWAVKIQHCHNLPTYEMSLKSDNVEFVRYCGGHFENGGH